MLFLGLYRLYSSLLCGLLVYFLAAGSVWMALFCAIAFRIVWYVVERIIGNRIIQRAFDRHILEFKQHCGPYGIRIANKAAEEPRIKASLAEVFTDDREKLKKTVEQLEVMDTFFNAGMRPGGDEFLLHDLKLKYGKHRLERK